MGHPESEVPPLTPVSMAVLLAALTTTMPMVFLFCFVSFCFITTITGHINIVLMAYGTQIEKQKIVEGVVCEWC